VQRKKLPTSIEINKSDNFLNRLISINQYKVQDVHNDIESGVYFIKMNVDKTVIHVSTGLNYKFLKN
jgi:hypothetical protein